jgi:sodium/potassium-transporting ATPase subunit alpha
LVLVARLVGVHLDVEAELIDSMTSGLEWKREGMSNWCLNWSLVFVTLGAYSLTVLPGMDVAMGMYPLRWVLSTQLQFLRRSVHRPCHALPLFRFHWWFAPVPFALAILIYDELRKYFIRRYPGGWMERATYY